MESQEGSLLCERKRLTVKLCVYTFMSVTFYLYLKFFRYYTSRTEQLYRTEKMFVWMKYTVYSNVVRIYLFHQKN